MIQYIKDLAATIQLARQNQLGQGVQKIHGLDVPDIHSLFKGFAEELERLDPRDFDPAARHDFVVLRVAIRNWAKGQIGNAVKALGSIFIVARVAIGSAGQRVGVRPAALAPDLDEVLRVLQVVDERLRADRVLPGLQALADVAAKMSTLLDAHQGVGSGAAVRSFHFVTNPDVKRIVERDYRELTLRAFPDGSWKSTVILSGSILEAVLYDILTKDAAAVAAAMGARRAPTKRGGVTKDILVNDYKNEWRLNDLINVACDLRSLPYADERAIHQVLREYRNLVHPRAEIAMGVNINEGHATASKGMLDVILDILS